MEINILLSYILRIVLIETYWNVNDGTIVGEQIQGLVLIETYWNVNLFRQALLENPFQSQ